MAAVGWCCCSPSGRGLLLASTISLSVREHNSTCASSAAAVIPGENRSVGLRRETVRDCSESSFFSCHQRSHNHGECHSTGALQDFYARGSGQQPQQERTSCSAWGSCGSSLFGDSGRERSPWNAADVRAPRDGKSGSHLKSAARCSASARSPDEAGTVRAIEDLSERLLSLKGAVNNEYRAIGPEMRGRVDRLYDRAFVLRQSADRAIKSGTRIPAQLTTNLIGLQREHGSLENIVRLTMEAAPGLEALEAKISKPNNLNDPASNVLLKEKLESNVFESLIRESTLSKKPTTPKYVMSAPASKGSSPLAAFRGEIERRVLEQLAKKTNALQAPAAVSDSSQLRSSGSQTDVRKPDEAPADLQLMRETSLAEEKIGLPAESPGIVGEPRSTDTSLEDKLKQVELELAKSIPIHIFEQKVSKISTSLSDARAQVTQLTAEVQEKEVMLATVKQEMLAKKDQLLQKVRELTGDLEKKYSVEDLEAAVNFGLQEAEKELEEEQDRTFLLADELGKKEKFFAEQQEKWRIEREEMEKQLKAEQDRSTSLALELERKDKLMTQHEEEWKEQKVGLELDLKSIQLKLQQIRKKRTKERAQLAEKKQTVKMLDLELSRVRESMAEGDKIRLKKKEATYATVRMLIARMVQASRERAEIDAQATSLGQELISLQEKNRELELDRKAAEERVGLAETTIRRIKSSLMTAGAQVPTGQGESSVEEKAAALEKFFSIMGQIIKQEAGNVGEPSPDFAGPPENEVTEEELDMPTNDNGQLPTAYRDEDKVEDEQEEAIMDPVTVQNETSSERLH